MSCDLTNVPWNLACEYVENNTDACGQDVNFIDYLDFVVCGVGTGVRGLRIFLSVLWLLYLFVALSVSADGFLCPIWARIVQHLGISQNIAGVTFLAFGNGAPDIFSAFAAVGKKDAPNSNLMFGALLGAGIFVTTVVVALQPLPRPFELMQRPFLRDVIFYLLSTFYLFVLLYYGRITLATSIGFFLIYAAYAFTVVIGRFIRLRHRRQRRERLNNGNGAQDRPEISHVIPPLRSQISSTIRSRFPSLSTYSPFWNDPELQSESEDDDNEAPVIDSDRTPIPTVSGAISVDSVDTGNDENYFNDDDALPLVLNVTDVTAFEEVRIPIREIARRLWVGGLEPFSKDDFAGESKFGKICLVCKAPVVFMFNLTIPMSPEKGWNKLLTVLQILICPIFVLWATHYLTFTIHNTGIPGSGIVAILCFALAVLVFWVTRFSKVPKAYPFLDYFGFAFTIIWIYVIASEVVNILETIGLVLHISSATLGLTVLAWANSIGDAISNFTMSYQGYPRIGISACFAGPMMNLLLGVGISTTFQIATRDEPFMDIVFTPVEQELIFFLAANLVFSLIWIPCRRFRADRYYSAILLGIYVLFMVIVVLTNAGKIPGFMKR